MKKLLFPILLIFTLGALFSFFVQEARGAETAIFHSTDSDAFWEILRTATSAQESWSLAHDADSTTVHAGSSYLSVRIAAVTSGDWYGTFIRRSAVYFDTSSLPDDATISSAVLRLYGMGAPDTEISSWTLQVQSGMPTYPRDPPQKEDYYYGYYSGNSGTLSSSAMGTGYKSITLNSTGRGWINKAGTTKFMLRDATYDIPDNRPPYIDGENRWDFYASEKGSGYEPILEVTYTTPTTAPTVITELATVNLSTNQATLRGNVTDTGGENPSQRVLEWGTSSGNYTNSHDAGSGGTGEFSHTISLTPGQTIYYRAKAYNSAGWGYGGERAVVIYQTAGGQLSFTTLEEVPEEYDLTIGSSVGGSVTEPDENESPFTYEVGTDVDLVATEDSGYDFVNWTGNTGTIANVNDASTTITMEGNYSITANFTEEAVDNPPWGFLDAYPSVVNVNEEITIQIDAYDDHGVNLVYAHYYGSWHSQSCGGATSCTKYWYFSESTAGTYTYHGYIYDTVGQGAWTDPSSVQVIVEEEVPEEYDLTINSTTGGSVTTPGEGDPVDTYEAGTVVDLVATPANGYDFNNWTGDTGTIADPNAASTTITMEGNYSIAANFEEEDDPTLSDVAWGEYCLWRKTSIPTFSWEPEGVYKIKIYGEGGEEFPVENPDNYESDIYVFDDDKDWIRDYLPFGGHTYSWQVSVDGSAWFGADFDTLLQAHPWVWPVSEDSRPAIGQEVQLCSTQQDDICEDGLIPPNEFWSECFGDPDSCNWTWDFNGIADCVEPDCENQKNPLVVFSDFGKDKEINLEICDDDLEGFENTDGCCSRKLKLAVTPPLPKWKEVAPF